MANFSFNITGLGELRNRIAKAPDKIKREISAELKDSANKMRMRAIQDAPADNGILRAGIQVNEITKTNYGIFSNALYSGYIEFGTKRRVKIPSGLSNVAAELRGKGGGSFEDMLDFLTAWVKRKGISGNYSVKSKRRLGNKLRQAIEDRQMALVIARSILRNGIRPQPFFFKQLDIERPVLIANIKNILGQL